MATEIACFISSHGFGHATRTIAILEALKDLVPDLKARVFTTIPENLFYMCSCPIIYHPVKHDIGLIQHDAFRANTKETISFLNKLLPFSKDLVETCSGLCRTSRLMLCDIGTLGIKVAHQNGCPSVLVENFTWDWIYQDLADNEPAFVPVIDLLGRYYREADHHIQTEPVCHRVPGSLTCGPIARESRISAGELARRLKANDRKIVLISMGGIPLDLGFIDLLEAYQDYLFVIAGQREDRRLSDNVFLLGKDSRWYHPDLIHAADLLLCKSGYSTIAECAYTDTPLCCVKRNNFPESPILESFVTAELNGCLLESDDFFNGNWLKNLTSLTTLKRKVLNLNGARQAALFLKSIIS